MEDDVDINTLTMEQYLAWVQDNIRPGMVKPKIGNDVEFEINSNCMRELRRKLFKGTDDEDAHKHVRRVLEIANIFHFPGVTHDAIMLRVFPITLKGPALRWMNRLLVLDIKKRTKRKTKITKPGTRSKRARKKSKRPKLKAHLS
ncbi:hypothetical protein Tco_1141516 [Tanacetum coccineum]